MPDKFKNFIFEGLAKHGLAVMISILLVIWLVARVDGAIFKIQQDMITANIAMSAFVVTNTHEGDMRLKVLQQICINTSKTSQDLQACIP